MTTLEIIPENKREEIKISSGDCCLFCEDSHYEEIALANHLEQPEPYEGKMLYASRFGMRKNYWVEARNEEGTRKELPKWERVTGGICKACVKQLYDKWVSKP